MQILSAFRPGCSLVTPLRGSAGYNGRSGETNAADVEIYLRNTAAERGADALLITGRHAGASWDGDTLSQPRGAMSSGGCPNCVTVLADAYRCAAPPAAVASPARGIEPPKPDDAGDAPFAEKAAIAALGAAMTSARGCRRAGDPTGDARVRVTFAPTGDVVYAEVEGEPFAGSAIGDCVARKFKNAHLPAFAGEARSMTATVRLDD